MSHVFVAKEWPCPLSIIRTAPVACHYNFKASCRDAKPPCRMSNLRSRHVAMSNLVVQTHSGRSLVLQQILLLMFLQDNLLL